MYVEGCKIFNKIKIDDREVRRKKKVAEKNNIDTVRKYALCSTLFGINICECVFMNN